MLKTIGIVTLLAGCATAPVAPDAPTVASVTQEVQVCGSARSFHVGEQVRFTRRECKPLSAKVVVLRCADEEVDRGEVVRVVDDRCAVVRVAAGGVVQPGDTPMDCNSQASKSQ
jgi:hypothetical protein